MSDRYTDFIAQTDERLIALETKLAYMEDFLNQIQEVTVQLNTETDRLKEENRLMKNKICEMSELLEGDIPNRKPPHY